MFFVAHVEVGINVSSGRDSRVPEKFGHFNQFCSIAEKDACEGVPLRYNYDTPEKARISRVFGY